MPALADAIGARPAAATRTGDLGKRVASAVVLAPLGLLALALGGWAWSAVMLLAMAGVATEWGAMCGRGPGARNALVGAVLAIGIAGAFGAPALATVLLGVGAIGLASVRAAGPLVGFGVLYVGVPGLVLLRMRALPHGGLEAVLLPMLATWASDTGAYAAGRTIGGPKLAPAISPAKTWSGAAGGLLAAAIVGLLFAWLAPALPWPDRRTTGAASLAAFAVLLAAAAQVGDLFESGCKRRFGVKDSGRLIPGHGGLLDRLDGLMAAAPVAALVLLLSHAVR